MQMMQTMATALTCLKLKYTLSHALSSNQIRLWFRKSEQFFCANCIFVFLKGIKLILREYNKTIHEEIKQSCSVYIKDQGI